MSAAADRPPFGRWGRVASPRELEGVYRLVEVESADGWRKPPPPDAVRVWQRRPGVASDHDDNWTVWLRRDQLDEWMSAVTFVEWLPDGVEPEWGTSAHT